jgi:hypothetical protein
VNLLRSILHDLALVILVVAGALGCAVLYKAMHAVDAVNATLAAVSAPCTGFHGSVTCGPIAQMSQTEKNIGILAAQGALQVKQSGALITATTRNMDVVAASVSGEISAMQGTTAALTTTAQTATASLKTITDGISPVLSSTNTTITQAGITIEGFQPVEIAATKSLTDFNTLLDNPSIPSMMDRADKMMGSGVDIFATTDAVEKKLAQCTLHPTLRCVVKSDTIFAAQVGGYLLH